MKKTFIQVRFLPEYYACQKAAQAVWVHSQLALHSKDISQNRQFS